MAAAGSEFQGGATQATAHVLRQQGRWNVPQQAMPHGQPIVMHAPQQLNVLADVACTVQNIAYPNEGAKSRQ